MKLLSKNLKMNIQQPKDIKEDNLESQEIHMIDNMKKHIGIIKKVKKFLRNIKKKLRKNYLQYLLIFLSAQC